MKLRPYQQTIIEETRALMKRGTRNILIQSPTGSGKTLLTAHMLKTAASRGLRSYFIVHRRELIMQSCLTFRDVGVEHGVIANGFAGDANPLVQLASIQTLAKRFHKYETPKLIVWDECHHVAAGSWSKIFKAFPDAFHIGLTATPERLDGRGLREFFSTIVKGPPVASLIEQGHLAPYRIFAMPGIQRNFRKRGGDFRREEVEAEMDRPSVTGCAIKEYSTRALGKRAVVFASSIEHSKHVVDQFIDAGIVAAHIDGKTLPRIRDSLLNQFRENKIQVISNVDLFGEGFDLPALEVAILLRPTQSLALFLQQCGRALRTYPGKTEALILDHAGNVSDHGLPDEEREWSLDGRKKKEKTASVKICKECFFANPPNSRYCAACKAPLFKIRGPRQIDHLDGELTELDKEEFRKQKLKEQGQADTLEALIQLGRERGYRYPEGWAKHVMRTRNAKRKPNTEGDTVERLPLGWQTLEKYRR